MQFITNYVWLQCMCTHVHKCPYTVHFFFPGMPMCFFAWMNWIPWMQKAEFTLICVSTVDLLIEACVLVSESRSTCEQNEIRTTLWPPPYARHISSPFPSTTLLSWKSIHIQEIQKDRCFFSKYLHCYFNQQLLLVLLILTRF